MLIARCWEEEESVVAAVLGREDDEGWWPLRGWVAGSDDTGIEGQVYAGVDSGGITSAKLPVELLSGSRYPGRSVVVEVSA